MTSETDALVDPQIVAKARGWGGYVEAKLGFRNHWYPALLSSEVEEGKPVSVKLLGERILVNRIDGKVFAIQDRCLHRGVALSVDPQCFTKTTVTCWYHGWTYRWDSGEVCAVISSPESQVIGNARLETFAVEEQKGLIFIFVGDIDPPDLQEDTPPGFLDSGVVAKGIRRLIKSNWRLGAENGFDSTHVFFHRNNPIAREEGLTIPLGAAPPKDRKDYEVWDEAGKPRGIHDLIGTVSVPYFTGTIDGEEVLRNPEGGKRLAKSTSIWMPGVLKVDPWPASDLVQYEWYVPEDEDNHWYIQVIAKSVSNEEEADAFYQEFDTKWESLALRGFNDEDIWAREALQDFYDDDRNWLNERLFEPDAKIMAWRRLASKANRGIQGARAED